jgi:hypothetical protein
VWKASNEAQQHQKRGVSQTLNQTFSWNFADLTARIFATILNPQLSFEMAGQNKSSVINTIKTAMCDGARQGSELAVAIPYKVWA